MEKSYPAIFHKEDNIYWVEFPEFGGGTEGENIDEALTNTHKMLERTFPDKYYDGTILHSDQGWQYQHNSYHQFLNSKGIRPSMSRKGNSPDNGMMESFFGILKSEMFYGYESNYKSLEDLEQAITNYIYYYNNKRIKVKLKGLSPVQYRTKSFA
ncbi:transposase [Streptococcus pseudoporcinus]|uniref:Transposase n=1 Tax=Streptococcus pseudoporcinus TaxID=361101 RepID=A0A4U9XHJ2_9STRE|nr:transposase [Streptococcus pseudoporcinus]VUC64966.1 transposase [Streptococcus pseudoporcinus]VUC95597.1 transposase [Streptococcus pseudoporcinus]VUC95993.1 transposase [Streptococcus pseudoporcinus]